MTKEEYENFAKKSISVLVERLVNYNGEEKYITYSDLANEIEFPLPHRGSQFGKSIGEVLRVMGHLFDTISVPNWTSRIPYIQSMVVAKNTKQPSDGLKEFYPKFPYLSKNQKKEYLKKEYNFIFEFGTRWEYILEELKIATFTLINPNNRLFNPYGSEGSPEHRKLRDHIAKNPQLVGLNSDLVGITEFLLKSADCIDVLFDNEKRVLGVEVKSVRSGEDDLLRGVFQCIKYRAVLEAESIINKKEIEIDCYLIHEKDLPKRVVQTALKLSVKTIKVKVN
ncbi:hypothetical protein ACNR9Q_00315 [Maribacter sp. X9]|uniref:hypothetical protein n=1 Tax=Maribacter sp. X9 TaxID=3402159 RepID=UPI003AF34499